MIIAGHGPIGLGVAHQDQMFQCGAPTAKSSLSQKSAHVESGLFGHAAKALGHRA